MSCAKPEILEWKAPPQMDTGAPTPVIESAHGDLYVSYFSSLPNDDDSGESYAVVLFEKVLQHTFGYPNDEALPTHPYHDYGLSYYAFNVINNSPKIKSLADSNEEIFPGSLDHYKNFMHWIVAFHDETLEIIGMDAKYLGSTSANNGHDAIAKFQTNSN